MKQKIKEILSIILTSIEKSLGFNPPKVTVLLFHSVSNDNTLIDIKEKNFAFQIKYLRENFDFINLDAVVEYINGNFIPTKPSVALTFDDGYEDILQNVIPTLEKYSIPATFFVVADPDNINRSELRNYKKVLNLKNVKKLNSNLFTVGSHTLTHIDLKNFSFSLGVREMKESKRILSRLLKTDIKYFAYPKGFYSEKIVEKAGRIYKASFGTDPGVISKKTNLQLINRMGVDRTISNKMFPALFTNWIALYFLVRPYIFLFLKAIKEIVDLNSRIQIKSRKAWI